jgi:acetoin utilization deacetylase AcuC-like enzyme
LQSEPAAPGDAGFVEAVEKGLSAIRKFGASVLVISLGFDAQAGDPTANLAVRRDGFRTIGERIGAFGLPTVLVQEGGYLIEKLTDNLSAFLAGFLDARSA